MSGLQLNMGLNGQGQFGSGFAGAAVPAAAQQPQGPSTISEKAFGVVSPGSGGVSAAHAALLLGGVASMGLLVWLYWSLPR